MTECKCYPLIFETNLKTLVWGTERWVVSGVTGSESVVANGSLKGKTLTDVVNGDAEAMLGAAVVSKYGSQLPLLAKIIDARQDLSIQVHPNDEMAKREHGKMGKSEMWYIIDADPGARLLVGFSRSISAEEYRQRVADGTITEVLASHPVKSGDVFYLPAGRVHAIGGGIRLAEIQQSSDVTYRIYDYGRLGLDGKPRELHTDLAAQAINFTVQPDYLTHYPHDKDAVNKVLDTPYFRINQMTISAPLSRNLMAEKSFVIVVSMSGGCRVTLHDGGEYVDLPPFTSCFIPAIAAAYDVSPLDASQPAQVLEAMI